MDERSLHILIGVAGAIVAAIAADALRGRFELARGLARLVGAGALAVGLAVALELAAPDSRPAGPWAAIVPGVAFIAFWIALDAGVGRALVRLPAAGIGAAAGLFIAEPLGLDGPAARAIAIAAGMLLGAGLAAAIVRKRRA